MHLLAAQLTLEFGKGFGERNLNNMRAFVKAFSIRDALRHELSWTDYITFIWNSRKLQRQINSFSLFYANFKC